MEYDAGRDRRVTIEDMALDDLEAVAELAHQAWFHSDYQGMQDKVSLFFVTQHLRRASLARVARLDGRVVGVMFANVRGEQVVYGNEGRAQMERLEAELEQSEAGRHFLSVFRKYVHDHTELEAEARQRCDAECQMYIVLPEMQGTGIGRLLWNDMIEYFRACGAKRYFLYTDTDCNWQIYKRKGLEKAAEDRRTKRDGSDYAQFIFTGGV